jgi:hypothetical protein
MGQIQQQMKATLEKTGLPFREIEVYGRQIVVTSGCEDTARKWASLLGKFAKVRGITHSVDERKTPVPYQGSMMQMKYVPVWRTFAAI